MGRLLFISTSLDQPTSLRVRPPLEGCIDLAQGLPIGSYSVLELAGVYPA